MPNYEFYKDFCVKYIEHQVQILKEQQNDNNIEHSLNDVVQYDVSFAKTMIQSWTDSMNKIQYYYNNNRRILTMSYKCLVHDVFEGEDYEFIDQYNPYFIEKYGIDLYSLNVKLQKKIEKIITRGKIRTDDEFRLINERVDELCQNDGDAEMIEACNKMLLDYEERAAEKLNKRKKKSES